MRIPRWIALSLFFAVCMSAGYLVVRTAEVEKQRKRTAVPSLVPPAAKPVASQEDPDKPRETRPKGDADALTKGAIAGRRTITFKDRESMLKFIEAMKGKGLSVLARLDGINTLTVNFLSLAELQALLDGTEKLGYVFPVLVPDLPEGTVQAGASPLGDRLAEYLGISEYDRTGWGKGVKVAVLDTGVSAAASFARKVSQVSLVEFPSDLSALNGHGTAVASLINQLAPEADILSYRIADDLGQSNSSLIAEGILRAVADGANIINISLGGYGDSTALREAVAYAQSMGVVIIASSGNNGINQLPQPASIEGVLAVGAVDAKSDLMAFSNTGEQLSAAAPGYGVTAEGTDGNPISFSGTSASTPIEAGAIAAAMSNNVIQGMSATDAATLYNNSLNEAGAPGDDPAYGGGTANLGRALSSTTPDVYDVALASQYVTSSESGKLTLQVTVENRGTTTVSNAPVQVTTAAGTYNFTVGTLAVNGIQTFEVPLASTGDTAVFQSTVGVTSGQTDANTANNRRKDAYTPASAQ